MDNLFVTILYSASTLTDMTAGASPPGVREWTAFDAWTRVGEWRVLALFLLTVLLAAIGLGLRALARYEVPPATHKLRAS